MPMRHSALKHDTGTEVGFASWRANQQQKSAQSKQQNLLWFRTRLGLDDRLPGGLFGDFLDFL